MRSGGEIADHHAEAVVERHRDADPVALGVPKALTQEKGVVQDVVVREGSSFGETGGAAGVLDIDRVVELHRVGTLAQLIQRNSPAGFQQVIPVG